MGTKEGGKKAAKINRLRHGADYYARIGAKGGKASSKGGTYGDPKRARLIGKLGGKVPRDGYSSERLQEMAYVRKQLAAL